MGIGSNEARISPTDLAYSAARTYIETSRQIREVYRTGDRPVAEIYEQRLNMFVGLPEQLGVAGLKDEKVLRAHIICPLKLQRH